MIIELRINNGRIRTIGTLIKKIPWSQVKQVSLNKYVIGIIKQMHADKLNWVLYVRFLNIHYESIIYYREIIFHSVIFDRILLVSNFLDCCQSLPDCDIDKQ